jgi:predicted nucleotidyltransferase
MDFEQKKRTTNNEGNYNLENLKIAREFSKEMLIEMKDFVRSIVLFGSNSKNTTNKNSDIDIMVVLDNVSVYVSPEMREA